MMIHPTAIIDPAAQVDPTTQVGPYAVIDAGVQVGPHCWIAPHVYLTGNTRIGSHNKFYAGCVIGEAPQDLKYKGEPTTLEIGDHNTFREHVTVNRSTDPKGLTRLGSHNLLMASCHVAHDCTIGNHVILANSSLLAGHVVVEDRAILSGNCVVHQFMRIGQMSFMQGGTAISQDLPPFTVARGVNILCGLNIVGLRRAGLSSEERLELKRAYHLLFRSRQPLRQALEQARARFASPAAQALIAFCAASTRGLVSDPGRAHAHD